MKMKAIAHVYVSDGVAPQRGDPWCTCGLPKPHPAHVLPATADEVREQEQRRMGEAE